LRAALFAGVAVALVLPGVLLLGVDTAAAFWLHGIYRIEIYRAGYFPLLWLGLQALWSSANGTSSRKGAVRFVGGGAFTGYAAGALASLVVWSAPDLQLGRFPIVLQRFDVFSLALAPVTTSAWVIGAAAGAVLLFCKRSRRRKV
jgi:hypothetical protein